MTGATVPESLIGLDVAWVTGVLREGGHSEAAVTGIEIEPLAISGAAADLARVRVAYDESGDPGPATVIAKIRGRDELRAGMDAAMGLYRREARFYSEFADRIPVDTPRVYHVGDGTETPLLIEDLGGLRVGDQTEGLRRGDAERVIDVLADLHAAYWHEPPADAGFLVDPGRGAYAAMIAQLVGSGAEALRERFAGRVGDDVLTAVAEHAADWGTVLERCAEGPPTFTHNDCRLDNIFFREDGSPVFVDWQIPARTRGTADVGNLIGGSMEPEDAAAGWEVLLRRYHDRLREAGVSGYGWDDCVRHYRVSALYALGPGIALLGSLGGTDARGVGEAIALRSLKHVEDLSSFAALGGE